MKACCRFDKLYYNLEFAANDSDATFQKVGNSQPITHEVRRRVFWQ